MYFRLRIFKLVTLQLFDLAVVIVNTFLLKHMHVSDHMFVSFSFYARKQLLLSARLSHCNSLCQFVRLSVCPSVTRVDQSKTVQARITKS